MNESMLSNIIDKIVTKFKTTIEISRELKRFKKEFAKNPGAETRRKFEKKADKIASMYGDHKREVKTMFMLALQEQEEKKIESFTNWIDEQERLDERLIVLNNSKKYNQALVLSGGAGSGKGFALSNFIDVSNYKVRDVDEIKRLLQKISSLGKINIEQLWKSADKTEILPNQAKIVSKVLAQNHYKLENLILKEPDHVLTLHIIVDIIGWKKKSIDLLKQSIPTNSDHKPNIVFDMTSKSRSSVKAIVQQCLDMGYEEKNIHLVWVLTDYKIAIEQNKARERVVPEDIMLMTHRGAANTLTELMAGQVPRGIDGAIWVILNNRENTIFWKHGDGNLRNTPELYNDSTNQISAAKVDQEKYDRIYGAGAFEKRNARTNGSFEKEKAVVKSFSRIHVKKAGKPLGVNVMPFATQLFNWVIANIPRSAVEALRTSFGVILGKHHGSSI